MFYGTAFSLLPPLVAIILALVTKQVYLSLFAGVALGALMIGGFAFWPSFDALYQTMVDNFDVPIVLFLILLSMDIVLMQKSGATAAYSDWASKHIKSRRAAMLSTSLLGILIFVDDGFNCLTIGSVMRPVTDRYKVSRAKLAYIIDATAAPVCIIAPVSSWAAAINSYVPDGAGISGFQLFLRTIPYNLYALLTLFMVFFTSATLFDFGLMKKAQERADHGDLGAAGEEMELARAKHRNAKMIDMILPMLVLIFSAIGAMIYTGYLNGGRTAVECFANCESAKSLVFATLITLVVIIVQYLVRHVLTMKEMMEIIPEGAKLMIPFMIILVLAWTLKGIINTLGAGVFIASVLDVNGSLVKFVPILAYAVAVFVSFSSGTSWGTFAIMVPIVINLFAGSDNLTLMTICVASVLAGAVCGDHISPISDTTIMSSSGALCDHLEHARTQIQYQIPVVIAAGIGFLIAGFVQNWAVPLVISLGILLLELTVIRLLQKRSERIS